MSPLRLRSVKYQLIFSTLICFFTTQYLLGEASARGQYLTQWEETYPAAKSAALGCQVCHQMPGGGNGWNSYGWSIRPIFLAARLTNGGDDQAALDLALRTVEENVNTDSVDGYRFIDEIRYNTQPGWVVGNNNTINFRDAAPIENQTSPEPGANDDWEIDLVVTEVPTPGNDPLSTETTAIDLYLVADNFNAPVKAVTAPGINGSIFVVEQRGKVIRVDLASGEKTTFLDIENQLVPPRAGFDERGLLSIAFHPEFETNGLFYTYQSEPERSEHDNGFVFTTLPNNVSPEHRSVISEYRASDPSCNSSITKTKTLMVIDQPQFNHNGGDLTFGPDGYLYISLGDGGGADDQGSGGPRFDGHGLLGNGRNNQSILGSILRIDPNGNDSDRGQYSIPGTNTFVGSPGLDEIFAYGFRNPYRISFDPMCYEELSSCNTLYAADVGQNKLEEINTVVNGGNYGWNWKEGTLFFIDPDASSAFVTADEPPGVPQDLIDPVAEYGRAIGTSITGGYVYRGDALAALDGRYIFADFFRPGTSRSIMSLEQGTIREFSVEAAGNITGFGIDVENELYVVATPVFGNPLNQEGTLEKIIPAGSANTYTSPNAEGESPICPPPPPAELCFPVVAENNSTAVICL